MFNSRVLHRRNRTKARRRAQITRRGLRRLGLEVMEGRLMLAAATLDTVALSHPFADFSSLAADQPVFVAALREDGFITFASPSSGTAFVLNAGLPRGTLSSDALSDLITNAMHGGSWTPVGAGDTTSSGIPAAVIVADGDGGFQLIPQPTAVENSASSSSQPEGGSISIKSILEGVPDVGEELHEGSRTGLIAEAPGAEIEEPRLTASPTKQEAVGGELERAIVFEIAGGDPVGIGHAVRHDGTDHANRTEGAPLSFRSTQQPSAEQAPRKMAEAAAQETPAPESVDLTSAVLEHPDSFVRRGNWLEMQANLATIHAETDAKNADPRVIASPSQSYNALNSAYEEAFDQLAKTENSAIYSLAEGASRRSLSAIPILTLLALERVAARSSRRVNKASSAVFPRRPLRQLAASEAGPDGDI